MRTNATDVATIMIVMSLQRPLKLIQCDYSSEPQFQTMFLSYLKYFWCMFGLAISLTESDELPRSCQKQ